MGDTKKVIFRIRNNGKLPQLVFDSQPRCQFELLITFAIKNQTVNVVKTFLLVISTSVISNVFCG